MSNNKEERTITMTEKQLESSIKTAVVQALRQIKEEEELPGNEINELKAAPATFSLINLISIVFLSIIIAISISFVFLCIKIIYESGFNFGIMLFGIAFIPIVIIAFFSLHEVNNTKKIEVINTVFNAVIGLSSLIVAIIGTYFAYMSM